MSDSTTDNLTALNVPSLATLPAVLDEDGLFSLLRMEPDTEWLAFADVMDRLVSRPVVDRLQASLDVLPTYMEVDLHRRVVEIGRTVGPDGKFPEPPKPATPIAVALPKVPQTRREAPQSASNRQPSSSGKFSVQVGAFADRAGADGLSASLRSAGYSVYLSDSRQGARWRVRVGPHRTREGAERTAERLKSVQQLPTWVLSEDS